MAGPRVVKNGAQRSLLACISAALAGGEKLSATTLAHAREMLTK